MENPERSDKRHKPHELTNQDIVYRILDIDIGDTLRGLTIDTDDYVAQLLSNMVKANIISYKVLQEMILNVTSEEKTKQLFNRYIHCMVINDYNYYHYIDSDKVDSISNTPLLFACEKGDRIAIKKIIDKKEDCKLNHINKRKRSALLEILHSYRLKDSDIQEFVSTIIEKPECDFNQIDPQYGDTILMLVCNQRLDKVALKMLDTVDCKINNVNSKGETCLSIACGNSLIDSNVAIKIMDTRGFRLNRHPNILIMACMHIQTKIALKILDHPDCDLDYINYNLKLENGTTPLMWACKNSMIDVILKIINTPGHKLYNIDNQGNTLLIWACKMESTALWACKHGMESIALRVLDMDDCDLNHVNFERKTALIWACDKRLYKVVSKMIDRSDLKLHAIDDAKRTVLIWACEQKASDIALKILDRPDCDLNSVNICGNTALTMSCVNNLPDVVEKIIVRPDLHSQNINSKEKTVLIWACKNGMRNIALKILDQSECYLNVVDSEGLTPLYWACITQMEDVALKILDNPECTLNYTGKYMYTPLIWAIHNKMSSVALKMIDRKDCAFSYQDLQGNTCLTWALILRLHDVALKILFRDDCVINQVNNNNDSPFLIACRNNMVEIALRICETKNIIDYVDRTGKNGLYWIKHHNMEAVKAKYIERGFNSRTYPS
jgi:ankyrin repeat protein